MKRYRILSLDFDSRATCLNTIKEPWENYINKLHEENQKIIKNLIIEYGEYNFEQKLNNFIDLKQKPFSISAFHNKFLQQIRNSYVIGSYYPALVGTCALGERILNHLILLLRKDYKHTKVYKKVYKKNSLDNWKIAIDTLEAWNILLPNAVDKFRQLHEQRNYAIHFNPATDKNDKKLALKAIHLMQDIVKIQFSSFGSQPWVFIGKGEIYIKKDWEEDPFVKHIYLPNCALVGHKHFIEQLIPKMIVNDNFKYEDKEITDDDFLQLRQKS